MRVLGSVIVFATDGETAGYVGWRGGRGRCVWRRDTHRVGGTADRRANWHRRRQLPMRCVETCLNEVLALGLRDEWLKLGGGERVDEAGLGHDE